MRYIDLARFRLGRDVIDVDIDGDQCVEGTRNQDGAARRRSVTEDRREHGLRSADEVGGVIRWLRALRHSRRHVVMGWAAVASTASEYFGVRSRGSRNGV